MLVKKWYYSLHVDIIGFIVFQWGLNKFEIIDQTSTELVVRGKNTKQTQMKSNTKPQ